MAVSTFVFEIGAQKGLLDPPQDAGAECLPIVASRDVCLIVGPKIMTKQILITLLFSHDQYIKTPLVDPRCLPDVRPVTRGKNCL
jgi:hypothetical protein